MSDQPPPVTPALPASLAGPIRHRFVSPHYDDIALSCGGTVALLANRGLAPEISVVFGDEPDPAVPLSPFAAAMHAGWGLSAGEVVAARRREEAVAAAAVGASSASLPFLDAIYRGRHYDGEDRLFGDPAPAEANLPDLIASALVLDTPPDRRVRVYAPLAVGSHVDHRHAFRVGANLARAGWDVWFYEDLPYALRDGALETRLAALPAADSVAPAATVDVATTWDVKLAAIVAYPSQLATVFRYVGAGSAVEEIDAVMRAYASRIGDGVLAERFWRLAAPPPA